MCDTGWIHTVYVSPIDRPCTPILAMAPRPITSAMGTGVSSPLAPWMMVRATVRIVSESGTQLTTILVMRLPMSSWMDSSSLALSVGPGMVAADISGVLVKLLASMSSNQSSTCTRAS